MKKKKFTDEQLSRILSMLESLNKWITSEQTSGTPARWRRYCLNEVAWMTLGAHVVLRNTAAADWFDDRRASKRTFESPEDLLRELEQRDLA